MKDDLLERWFAVRIAAFADQTLEARDWNCFVVGWDGVESERFVRATDPDSGLTDLDLSELRAWNYASGFCSGVVLFWCCRVGGGAKGVAMELVVDDSTLGGYFLGRTWQDVPPPTDVHLKPCIVVSFTDIAKARREYLPLAQRFLGVRLAEWFRTLFT